MLKFYCHEVEINVERRVRLESALSWVAMQAELGACVLSLVSGRN